MTIGALKTTSPFSNYSMSSPINDQSLVIDCVVCHISIEYLNLKYFSMFFQIYRSLHGLNGHHAHERVVPHEGNGVVRSNWMPKMVVNNVPADWCNEDVAKTILLAVSLYPSNHSIVAFICMLVTFANYYSLSLSLYFVLFFILALSFPINRG